MENHTISKLDNQLNGKKMISVKIYMCQHKQIVKYRCAHRYCFWTKHKMNSTNESIEELIAFSILIANLQFTKLGMFPISNFQDYLYSILE